MVGWHHRFNGHEPGQIPGDGGGWEAWCVAVHGSQRAVHHGATEQQPFTEYILPTFQSLKKITTWGLAQT